jgi:hypothetical protein
MTRPCHDQGQFWDEERGGEGGAGGAGGEEGKEEGFLWWVMRMEYFRVPRRNQYRSRTCQYRKYCTVHTVRPQ